MAATHLTLMTIGSRSAFTTDAKSAAPASTVATADTAPNALIMKTPRWIYRIELFDRSCLVRTMEYVAGLDYISNLSPFPFPKLLLPKPDNTTPKWRKVYQRMSMVANECQEGIVQKPKGKTKNGENYLMYGNFAMCQVRGLSGSNKCKRATRPNLLT